MQNDTIDYSIVFSSRKTISICITKDGTVLVRAPRFVSKKEIHKIVMQKSDWIIRKQREWMERNNNGDNNLERSFVEDSMMPYLGEEYPIHILLKNVKKAKVELVGKHFMVTCSEVDKESIRKAFVEWYVNKAKEVYQDRIVYYYNIIQEPFGQVRIKDQKSCYGSCSSRRNLNFNYRIVLAPLQVLDYIVVHEMCHLKQMNHSKMFWAEVEKVMPDYKVWKLWLKNNGKSIEL